jgi:hypothetical protein
MRAEGERGRVRESKRETETVEVIIRKTSLIRSKKNN